MLLTSIEPLRVPDVIGANATRIVQEAFAAKLPPLGLHVPPTLPKSATLNEKAGYEAEMKTLVLCSVIVWLLLCVPTVCHVEGVPDEPNVKLVGETEICAEAGAHNIARARAHSHLQSHLRPKRKTSLIASGGRCDQHTPKPLKISFFVRLDAWKNVRKLPVAGD